MPTFRVEGAGRDSGKPIRTSIAAKSKDEALKTAQAMGILVADIHQMLPSSKQSAVARTIDAPETIQPAGPALQKPSAAKRPMPKIVIAIGAAVIAIMAIFAVWRYLSNADYEAKAQPVLDAFMKVKADSYEDISKERFSEDMATASAAWDKWMNTTTPAQHQRHSKSSMDLYEALMNYNIIDSAWDRRYESEFTTVDKLNEAANNADNAARDLAAGD